MCHFLLLLLISTPYLLLAQTDFAPIGATWHYQYEDQDSAPWGYGYYKFESVGDSIVNGKTCRQINQTKVRSDSTATDLFTIFVYNQNDSIYRYSELTDDFYLLMDYTAEVGDTLVLTNMYSSNYYDSTFVVVEQSNEIIDGQTLKKWLLDFGTCGIYQEYYEKIGSPFGFDPQQNCIVTYFYDVNIRCYEDNEISLSFIDQPCDAIISSAKHLSISALEIFPNPATEHVQLLWGDHSKYNIELINVKGQVIKRMNAVSSGEQLNLEALNSGFYYLKFIDKQGDYLVRKIVKI